MREILPLAGFAVFQIDEEIERTARTASYDISKAHQFLALGRVAG